MGVRNLWQIIGPYGHKISVAELQKKQIAVDLGGWLCENQLLMPKNMYFSKVHLRNIFFRTAVLLLADVTPVFIMDGSPPKVKTSTLIKRNQARCTVKTSTSIKRNQAKAYNKNQDNPEENHKKKFRDDRKSHKFFLNECQGLLNFLGLECLWSSGEGEGLCALLDQKGIVDGVITQDNDAFLYGAKKVYRNFTIANGFGTVEVFKMSDVEKHLNLTKEKLVAMSVLSGCDYNSTGIHGIGTAKSLKYLSSFDGDVFTRLKELRHDKDLTNYDMEKNGCSKCHHPGKLSTHIKFGCTVCGTQSKCVENNSCQFNNLSIDEKMRLDFELEIRQKTITDPEFPDMETVNEYLNFPQNIPAIKGKWMEPDIVGFMLFMKQKCKWSHCYSFQKIIPLYCRWSLLNKTFKNFIPRKLLKKRVLKGVPSFEVEWHIRRNFYNTCKSHDNCIDNLITTVEPEVLIIEKCKNLYDSFMLEVYEKSKKNKKSKKKKNKEQDIDELTENVNSLSIGNENMKPEVKFISNDDQSENMNLSSVLFDANEKSELGESYTNLDLNDSLTVDYDLSDYRINESSILESIISRREYY